jgi:hypothetical protein
MNKIFSPLAVFAKTSSGIQLSFVLMALTLAICIAVSAAGQNNLAGDLFAFGAFFAFVAPDYRERAAQSQLILAHSQTVSDSVTEASVSPSATTPTVEPRKDSRTNTQRRRDARLAKEKKFKK